MGIILVEGESVNQGGSGGGGGDVTSQDLADAIAAREAAQQAVDTAQDNAAAAEESDDDTKNAAQDALIAANEQLAEANEDLIAANQLARDQEQDLQNQKITALEEVLGTPIENFNVTQEGIDSGSVVMVWANSGANQQRILSDGFYVSDDPDSFTPLTTVNIPSDTTKRLYIVGRQYINSGTTAGTAAIGASIDFTNTDGVLTATVISANSTTSDYATTTFNQLTNINNLNPSISQAHINYIFAAEQGQGFIDLNLAFRTSRDRLSKQGNNLIWNGFGHSGLENLFTNTPQNLEVSHEPEDCSFKLIGSVNNTLFFEDAAKIDPTVPLRHKGLVRGTDGRVYFGIRFLDANGQIIQFHHHTYFDGTTTVLTQPFSSGDTVMHLADVSAWIQTDGNNQRGGLAFTPIDGYKVGKAVEDEFGMTQYAWNNTINAGSGGGYVIDTVANTLTFAEPVTRNEYFDDTDTWPVGTFVRQPITRGPYRYTLVNFIVSEDWHSSDVTIPPSVAGEAGLVIPKGAEFAQAMFLVTRNVTNAPATQWIKNMSLTQGL